MLLEAIIQKKIPRQKRIVHKIRGFVTPYGVCRRVPQGLSQYPYRNWRYLQGALPFNRLRQCSADARLLTNDTKNEEHKSYKSNKGDSGAKPIRRCSQYYFKLLVSILEEKGSSFVSNYLCITKGTIKR